jgi:hypothetical protein
MAAKLKAPKTAELKKALEGLLAASPTNRVKALTAAVQWYDAALPYFIQNVRLDPSKQKLYDLATKTRSQANGTNLVHEQEVALKSTVQLLEKVWKDAVPNLPSSVDAYAEYQKRRAALEAQEAANKAKYQAVVNLLNLAFGGANLKVSVIESQQPRAIDFGDAGEVKIVLGDQHVAELSKVLQRQGPLDVIFSEVSYAARAMGVTSTNNGPALDPKAVVAKLPTLFAGMHTALKGAKAAKPAVTRTAAAQQPGAAATTPTRSAPASSGPLVGGLYKPGTNNAIAFQFLSDQKYHTWQEIAQGTGAKYPKDGPYYIGKDGAKNGKWTVRKDKHGVQLIFN